MFLILDQLGPISFLDVSSLFCTSKCAKCSQSGLSLDCKRAKPKAEFTQAVMLLWSCKNGEMGNYLTVGTGCIFYTMEKLHHPKFECRRWQ